MTKDFENMLYLLGENAIGQNEREFPEINIEEVRDAAISQGIWTLIYPELEKICDVSIYQNEFLAVVSKGISRTEFSLGIIKMIEEKGVRCCILKGAVVAGLYRESNCRISSDTDILINPNDEDAVKKILIENGYTLEKRNANDHHLKAYHIIGGLMEVHVSLYSKMTSEILFSGKKMYNEPWSKMNINGYDYNVLGINDGLIYLTAHYIKHFINEGGGVRQMMDLLLYMKHFENKIDFDKYYSLLKELRYDKIIEVVKGIGTKYFGFDFEYTASDELLEQILDDTEKGGIFGGETNERKQFYYKFCENRTSLSKSKYKFFRFFSDERGIIKRLFPSSEVLVSFFGYTYAKHRIMVPIAWINRIVDRFIRKKHTLNHCEGFDKRMQLVKDLNMID